ncbi:uncharacterized protein GGS22DRAFT_177944 [Annulohypoxylon maeteangense]|uniref:uncharacterized protein n=1 Tax=Annulohypoxylon maeteangense TaxID=1927788 RepID=UPI00200852F2|nr:uncharacterized protein GGS22DRAFT_177944 [Annulohypoxylon maeteangense]KAI0887696.1 hypothetical protein GGS22DRAFT_177944 [Annulohypoxylon maeteangense]
MADTSDSTSQPIIQPQHSQRSVARRLASSSTSTTHRRIGSDGVSLSSRSQIDNSSVSTRPVSLLSESQQWLPIMGATGPTSSPMPTPAADWLDEGCPGSQPFTSPNLTPEFSSQSYLKADSFQGLPAPPSKGPRPKPAPMQFEDVPVDYYSPPGSSHTTFTPHGRSQHSRTSSRSHLLNTPTSTAWRSPRTPPPYSTVVPQARKWWHWRPVWSMYLTFLFGIACAVGHHIFYKTLNGKPADAQITMLRYGTILSFASKAGLVAAIVIAFKQRIWTTVRNKFLSVAALDSLFAATEDMSALFNTEVYQRAKIAMVLAIFVWLTPIMIILTSNTLTVRLVLRADNTTCPGIRTLNFTRDELEEWRTPTRIEGLYGKSLSLWNTTSLDTASSDWFDYYTGSSNPLIRVATQAAFMGQPIGRTGADIDICGSGWNCSFTINFTAPAYECSELASGVGSDVKSLGKQIPPDGFDTKLLVPEGNYSYYAFTGGGDYATPQMNMTMPGGIPTIQPPFPETLGAFRTEPAIWVGYSVISNPNEAIPLNSSYPGWNESFIPKILGCEHYEAHYTVLFNLIGGRQFTNVTKRTLLRRVMDTTWIQGEDANDGTNDNTTALPKSGYVYPKDVRHYRRVAAYHAMGTQLRSFLEGTIDSHQVNTPIENTKAEQTTLVNQTQDIFPSTNLLKLIPALYEDMILSMLSDQQFVSVVWAAKPDESSGAAAGNESTRYPCTRSRLENVYDYHERDLWIVYSLAILLAMVGMVLGTLAILENEWVLRSTRFSSIVAATRGPALEKLGWIGDDDRGDLPRDVKNLKVGYGIVHRASGLGVLQEHTGYNERVVWDGGDVRYGFGLEGDVRQPRSQTRREDS